MNKSRECKTDSTIVAELSVLRSCGGRTIYESLEEIGILISVPNLFGETEKISDFKLCSVIKNCRSAEFSEHLMTCLADNSRIEGMNIIINRNKIHIKSAVGAYEFPWLHHIVGDFKKYLVKLVAPSVIENHIFACGICITEAVTEIEAERLAVNNIVSRTPVPSVVISPDTSAPVKGTLKSFL